MLVRKKLYLLLTLIGIGSAQAQISYTVLQLGGNFGVANKGYQGAFSGFAGHFIFGKSFDEKAYLGFGVGNEQLKGDYRSKASAQLAEPSLKYDYNLFPLFVDARLPLLTVGQNNSKVGILANAGYAPAIGARYDKGFLLKSGFFYLLDNPKSVDFSISLAHGYQQLTKNFYQNNFQHQQVALAVGIIFK